MNVAIDKEPETPQSKPRKLQNAGQSASMRLYPEINEVWKQLAEREGLTKTAWFVRQVTLEGRKAGLLSWPGRKKEIVIE